MNHQPIIYHKELQVIQYNTNQSRDQVMAIFLWDPKVRQADIIAIQEPWNNPYSDTTYHPANQTHLLLYPKQEEIGQDNQARVCMLVNRRLYPALWQHKTHSGDLQTLKLTYRRGNHIRKVHVHNIYNQQGCGTIAKLGEVIESERIGI
jgi:hypothetical protein